MSPNNEILLDGVLIHKLLNILPHIAHSDDNIGLPFLKTLKLLNSHSLFLFFLFFFFFFFALQAICQHIISTTSFIMFLI